MKEDIERIRPGQIKDVYEIQKGKTFLWMTHGQPVAKVTILSDPPPSILGRRVDVLVNYINSDGQPDSYTASFALRNFGIYGHEIEAWNCPHWIQRQDPPTPGLDRVKI